MKVLLREDIDNLGFAGEVRDVSPGYGRNFLIPQGLAVLATPGRMKQAEVWRKKAEARRAQIHAEYQELSDKISGVTLTFQARASESGKLFGSVTTTQIADALNEQLGTEIDRRHVGVEPLRRLGSHRVVVRLSGDFQPELTVVIEPEDVEEAPQELTEVVTPEDLMPEAADDEEEFETAA